MADLISFLGDRVRLKVAHTGVRWHDNGTSTGKRLAYTVHEGKAGQEGTVVGSYSVLMDDGLEIGIHGNDFVDPDEQFAEIFERIGRGSPNNYS